MAELRALLMVDVVDSTELIQRLGDASAASLWSAHDRVARDLLATHRGQEIDKTDGFLLLFAEVGDAVRYALAYHRAVQSLPVPVKARAGLHYGPVVIRENSAQDIARGAKPHEVDGLGKATAARTMSLAQGGQTLLTADARRVLHDDGWRVQSHGHWRMKGVAEPVELFEVGAPDAPFVPPPDSAKVHRVTRRGALWLPAREIANNLPQPVTRFVGRERECADLLLLLSNARLVTLHGAGGMGKTRLSLQVALAVLGDFPDGVWFVELAALSDERQVPQAVATALGVKEEPGRTMFDALVRHVHERQLLVVLDNCEHLAVACGSIATKLLQAGAAVKVMATSRAPLQVSGETVYSLPALGLPASGASLSLDAVARSEAVHLFVERACAAQPAFRLDAGNAAVVAHICRRLDGIPLALELAAARVRALPIATIAERLGDRFRLLTGGNRAALPRQQTLRAMIDWSHDLLTEPERILLRRMSVFAGGWTLEAAEAVASGDGIDAAQVLDLLTQLVDRSLVVPLSGGVRYQLLETVRAYAAERLELAGEAAAMRHRHFEHFLDTAVHAGPQLWGAQQGAWVARLDADRENFLAAHRLCDEDPALCEAGLRLVSKLQLYWMPSGSIELGYRLTRQALDRPGAQAASETRCGALNAASQLSSFLGDFETARSLAGDSLAIARAAGLVGRTIDTLLLLGWACEETGRADDSARCYEEAIELAREHGDRARESYALNALAGYEVTRDGRAAASLFEQSYVLAREAGDDDSAAITRQNLARCLMGLGEHRQATVHVLESLSTGRRIGATRVVNQALDLCVAVAWTAEQFDRVARYFGAAEAHWQRIGVRRTANEASLVERSVAQARAQLTAEAFAQQEAQGSALDPDELLPEIEAWLTGLVQRTPVGSA